MATNCSSMTIWAGSDTKEAAKQVMTFFLRRHPHFGWNLLISSGAKANCTRNGGVLQKKRSTPVLPPLSVSALCLVTHSQACCPQASRFFNHKNMVSLRIASIFSILSDVGAKATIFKRQFFWIERFLYPDFRT